MFDRSAKPHRAPPNIHVPYDVELSFEKRWPFYEAENGHLTGKQTDAPEPGAAVLWIAPLCREGRKLVVETGWLWSPARGERVAGHGERILLEESPGKDWRVIASTPTWQT